MSNGSNATIRNTIIVAILTGILAWGTWATTCIYSGKTEMRIAAKEREMLYAGINGMNKKLDSMMEYFMIPKPSAK